MGAIVRKCNIFLNQMETSSEEMCIQSYNVMCFSSQHIFPFLFSFNVVSSGPSNKQWVFTEAKTGQGRLDAHFLFVNVVME